MLKKPLHAFLMLGLAASFAYQFISCSSAAEAPAAKKPNITIELDAAEAAQLAKDIRSQVSVQLAEGLELSLWASDSLAPDPIALAFDQQGNAYITRTNRQKHSEFDIRGHTDWMIASISLKTVEDRRAFLRETFAPEKSKENEWLADLNGDSLHDWRDLAVETEEIFRLKDRDGDGIADFSQVIVDDFHEEVTDVAGAMLPHDGAYFLGVAPDMWRLEDTDGDGIIDKQTSISHGYQVHIGFGGHGMSGLTVGPDGKIYWGIGDIGSHITGPDGKEWSQPNEGAIFRANPDGSDFEVFAKGLRNTHEFTFDEYGNIISVDNDGDHPGEKERLVYIVEGSDSGWRINWQFGKYTDPDNNTYKVWMDEEMFKPRFEGQAAYITPPLMNYHSGPAGMKYNPGTALSPEWAGRFFVAEFTGSPARSNVYAFKLAPKGAGFEFVDEKTVLNGILVTGLDFGPDGAMYVADWLDGWDTKNTGRIWKVDVPGGAQSAIRQEVKQLLGEDFKTKDAATLSALLHHADMRVRLKAQFALAGQGKADVFQAALQQKEHQLARVHAIWGLGQLARKDAGQAAVLLPYLTDEDVEIRAQVLKLLGDIRYAAAGDEMIPYLKDASARVRFFAAEALGRIAHKPAQQAVIDMLIANNEEDVYLRHAGALALSRFGDAAGLTALSKHPSKALRIAAVVALRKMRDPGLAQFLQDGDEFVVTEAARAINDDLSVEAALPALAEVLGHTKFQNQPLIRRAINAALRTGSDQSLALLVAYAGRKDVPEALRVEAIAALGVWAKPSVLDRVDGRLRGPVTRDPAAVRKAVQPVISAWLSDAKPAVKVAAAETAGRLQLSETAATLFEMLKPATSSEVKIAALKAMSQLKDTRLQEAIRINLADKDQSVRAAAISLVSDLKLPDDQTVALLSGVLENGSIEEKQTVLGELAKLPAAATSGVLSNLLNQMVLGKLPAGLQLDLTKAVEASHTDVMLEQLKSYQSAVAEKDPVMKYGAALEGGDGRRGARIFFSNATAQCVRCHAVGNRGESVVGPNLGDVGSKYDRRYLLESLVNPSAQLSPGYGSVILTMNDGQTINGILMEESAVQLVLKTSDAEPVKVPKMNIKERENLPSAMPGVGELLDLDQLRDLVQFLSERKTAPGSENRPAGR